MSNWLFWPALADQGPAIIGDVTVHVDTSGSLPLSSSFSHVVPAETEQVVVAIMLGNQLDGLADATNVQSDIDGALDLVVAPAACHANFPTYFIYSFVPTITTHQISYSTQDAAGLRYSAAFAVNLKNVGGQFGAVDAFAEDTGVSTLSRSITPEEIGSLLLSFGAAQGSDTDPFTALHGATLLETGDTGGGSTTNDGGYGVAVKTTTSTAPQNYGFSWSSGDGHGIAMVEVRSTYKANPVNFDGTNDFLFRGAQLTGAADSKLWTISFWARRAAVSSALELILFATGAAFEVFLFTDNKMNFKAENAASTTILSLNTSAITDTGWHHYMLSVDMADTAKRHLYVDGVSDLTVNTYTNDTIDFTTAETQISASGSEYAGDIADFQMWDGVYLDLSIQSNREFFIKAGKPVDPAIASSSLGTPIIRFSGATNTWHTNDGDGGGFTEGGALTDGTGPVEL